MDSFAHLLAIYTVLVVIVTSSAIIDYKYHRIPNWLSFSGWYLGPVLHLYFAGSPAFGGALMGLVVTLMLTFPLFALNWMGAGDVKLMTSVGALVGVEHALMFLLSIVISGLVIGIAQLFVKGLLPTYVRRYCAILGLSIASCRPVYVAPDGSQQTVIMPYAISIAMGSLVALILI